MAYRPTNQRSRVFVFVIASLAFCALAVLFSAGPTDSSVAIAVEAGAVKATASYNEKGELIRPEGYREWLYVGTPVTPNDMNDGEAPFPEFHSVYMDPRSYAHYKKTGQFRDGTVLVKELISVGSKEATSGAGYFMGEYIGLEVALKDAKRFKDEPGNWAYFSFGHKYPLAETAKPQNTASCNACHDSSADEDYVFTQYYPVLRALKKQSH